jgi:hypothetical protein
MISGKKLCTLRHLIIFFANTSTPSKLHSTQLSPHGIHKLYVKRKLATLEDPAIPLHSTLYSLKEDRMAIARSFLSSLGEVSRR